jgi:hypothetical protein
MRVTRTVEGSVIPGQNSRNQPAQPSVRGNNSVQIPVLTPGSGQTATTNQVGRTILTPSGRQVPGSSARQPPGPR